MTTPTLEELWQVRVANELRRELGRDATVGVSAEDLLAVTEGTLCRAKVELRLRLQDLGRMICNKAQKDMIRLGSFVLRLLGST
jgi:hypothetical protein